MMVAIMLILLMGMMTIVFTKETSVLSMKSLGLIFSFSGLWLSMLLWLAQADNPLFQSPGNLLWSISTLGLSWGPVQFGLDEISLPFVVLTGLLIPMCMMISWNSMNFLVKEFMICLLSIHLLLIMVFTSLNMLLFYIAFEGILIPMFLMMGVWGASSEKESAAYYFFFFTLAGSLMMLLGLFALYVTTGHLDFQYLMKAKIPEDLQIWMFLGFLLSFGVKVPKVPLHMWLPQAHVEAPVAGSVLLAGVLLKLGGYGFLSFSWPLFPYASEFFTPLMMLLASMAMIYASLSTCRQVDVKKLVAYSSVAHMGLVTMAIFSKTTEGLTASMILMLAHGFVSSGLFIMVTNLYDSFHTSTISYFKGSVYSMPVFTTIFFVLLLGNMAFPMTMNFMGEFFSILSGFQLSWLTMLCPLIGMVLSGAYSFILFNKISFGSASSFTLFLRDLTSSEFQAPTMLILFTFLLGLAPNQTAMNLAVPTLY